MPIARFIRSASPFGRAIAAVITAGALASALVAIANAFNFAEPHWIATRSFTRETVHKTADEIQASQDQMKTRQIRVELQVMQGRRDSIKAKISDRELLLQQPDGPPQYRQLIRQQVDEFQDSLRGIDERILELRRELSAR